MVDLKRMRYLINTIPDALWVAERRMASATRVTSNITGMPRGGGGANRQEDANVAYADAVDAYRDALSELKAMQDELSPLIEKLENLNEKGIMEMRYMKGHSPTKIAETLHYSDRMVFYYLERAEQNVMQMT